MEKTNKRSRLQLIDGGLYRKMWFGPLLIVAAPAHARPFEVDAMAFEEDTWLTMSADPKVCPPEVHPIRLMKELMEARPETAGTVIVKGKKPIRFLAIVHDVNLDPTWKENWIEDALSEIFQKTEEQKLRAIGLPLLGTLHGRLEIRRFIALLSRVLSRTSFHHLQRLWLITPAGANRDLINLLKSMMDLGL